MNPSPLSQRVKLSQAITPSAGAAGTGDVAGHVLDMADFDAVLVVVALGAIAPGAQGSVLLQRDSTPDFSWPRNLGGTELLYDDTAANTVMYLDIVPELRVQRAAGHVDVAGALFVRLLVQRWDGPSTIGAASYVQYQTRERRVPSSMTHGAGVRGVAVSGA